MKKLSDTLQSLREAHGYTQEELARMLNISRVTLANIESGKRAISKEELVQYANIFDIPAEAIKQGIFEIPKKKVIPGNLAKFKELLLYILYKVGMKPNVGKTVLYKLLYFCDFDYYEKYGQSMTGMNYIKLPMWPAPYKFDKIMQDMEENKELLVVDAEYMWYHQQRLIWNRQFQNVFSHQEYEIIDEILKNLSNANAKEISNYSHEDAPRKKTDSMEIIDYNLVRQRDYPYSILAREQKKAQAFAEIKSSGMFDDLADESDYYERYR